MTTDIVNTGAYFLARALKQHGVTRAFGLCGDHINSLYRAAALEGIEIIGTRSESGAVHMADAWARVTGTLGVAFVTGCPGHTNALTGMAVATNATSPVLVISGLTPTDQRERGGSQVLEQGDLARPVAKWSLEVPSSEHLAEMVVKAIQIATTGSPGAVSLSVPADVLDLPVTSAPRDYPGDHVRDVVRRKPVRPNVSLQAEVLDDIEQLLKAAKTPIMILGSGARHTVTDDLQRAITRLGIPVFTIDQARGLVPDDGQNCFGYADPFFNRIFRAAIRADTILLVGSTIDFHTCFGREQLIKPDVNIIQISDDATHLNRCRQNQLSVLGPPSPVLVELADKLNVAPEAWVTWRNELKEQFAAEKGDWAVQAEKHAAVDDSIHPLQVCRSLDRHRTSDTGIIIDAGDFVHWPRAYFSALAPGRWMDAVLIGNLGGSLPLGIGSQIAHDAGQTWVFIGDGGFAFYSWDLEVAVQKQLPIKIILGNDAAWGIEKRLQLNEYGAHVGCELARIRYDRFAEMMGAKGFHVDRVQDLDAVIDEFIAAPGPALLNVGIREMASRPLADFRRY
ncbi:hypothetical protein CR159_11285 [Pollutimonas subterranea]|uniref:Acetolactate synthase-1/2/3 large subunit n=1 Tax=Pollutimonas subterranea TaxID=2045210 RepID=A0A2N4U4B3_9BURK|nr:thiamine pyrophosphate-binding protein [Pollutimonas subterranea]PLC49862.1 hypothetical protein CR159_11285 [Pollutimonas subterranea]